MRIARLFSLSQGMANALSVVLFLLIGFVAPLLAVIGFSVMPARTFSLWQAPTLANYWTIVEGSNYISFLASLGLAAFAAWAAKRAPSPRHSYGFGRAEVMAAFVNARLDAGVGPHRAPSAHRRSFCPVPR